MNPRPHTVIVVLDAIEGKAHELEAALEEVALPSRSEPACIEYRLHKSKDNPCQFILYENWESKEKHAEQFEKPYIRKFSEKAGPLLTKPYLAIIAEEKVSS